MNFDTATLHEASGRIGALPQAIKPVASGMRVVGPALPVKSPPADNLWLHRAIEKAAPGDVLVVDVSGHFEAGYWGEVMSVAAQARGIAGLVIDGSVRDRDRLDALGFPVFARGLCIRGTSKMLDGLGSVGEPVAIGDTSIGASDLVVGDSDGVVVIPHPRVEEVLKAAERRLVEEAEILKRLRNGESTLDIYGWR